MAADPQLTAREHVNGAQQDEAAAEELARCGQFGWAVTALFYSALHYARAYVVARHGVRLSCHEDMRLVWKNYPETGRFKACYMFLKQQSEAHRYYCVQFDGKQYSQVREHYDRFRRVIDPMLDGRPLDRAPTKDLERR